VARRLEITADDIETERRLSAYLKSRLRVTRSLLINLRKNDGSVQINGHAARLDCAVRPGDSIVLQLPESYEDSDRVSNIAPLGRSVPVLYEDEDFLVMDKPAGMPVHPSRAHIYGTLANSFAAAYPGIIFRPITRLDADTSGAVLIAKNKHAASIDRAMITRIYYGVTDFPVLAAGGIIDAGIERETENLPKRIVRQDGKRAVTHFRRICMKNGLTLLRFSLETGRTHQIRVHCAYMGFPLCGDAMYGGNTGNMPRQALHAAYIRFINPLSGKKINVKSGLPADIHALISRNNEF